LSGFSHPEFETALEALRPTLRLAVIYGGDKRQPGAVLHPSANTRPWKSYEAVATTIAGVLVGLGFQHVALLPDDLSLGAALERERIDLAWLNTAGVQGHNPMAHAPSLLELAGIPYVGHGPLNVTRLDNKHLFKRELAWLGIPTAAFMSWAPGDGAFSPASTPRFAAAFGDYEGPFVVKPVSGRASLHVTLVEASEDLAQTVEEVMAATHNPVLIERYLPGREFCVSVCGALKADAPGHGPFAFSTVERRLDPGEKIFTSMDFREITARRITLVDETEWALRQEIEAIARQVYQGFDLGALVRIDLRQDASGRLHVLEANPKPDLRRPDALATSLTTFGLPAVGLGYDDLISNLLTERLYRLLTREAAEHARFLALFLAARENAVGVMADAPKVGRL
jgi:D-alanine-D-alanine ligase